MIRQAAGGLLAAILATVATFAAGAASAQVAAPATPAAITSVFPAAAPVPARVLTQAIDARVVGDRERTRFVLDLTESVSPTVFPLADPYRLVIDLNEVRFALSAGAGQAGRGLIATFRYGQFSAGKSRVVIDLTAPVAVDRTYVTDAAAGQPARLVVELVPATRAEFLAAAAAYRASDAAVAASARPGAVPGAGPRASARRVVVIDPGHGGLDLGAIGKGGNIEKNIALAFSRILAERLTATGRYDVYLTRSEDTFLALGDRVSFAQGHNADLLISVHANSYSSSTVRGAAVYTLCEKLCDAEASRMALSENQSDVLAGIDVAAADSSEVRNILTDLTRRETMNFAQVFAANLVKELRAAETPLFKEPHQEANFKVLTAADVPSALVELGFITNPTDEKLLASPEWQAATADAMVRAVGDYFGARLASSSRNGDITAVTPR